MKNNLAVKERGVTLCDSSCGCRIKNTSAVPTNTGSTTHCEPETSHPSLTLSLPTHSCLSQAHRLTPDFPEALYELLCTLQEGRRLNDQRCSFRLESGVRRRCHSEPNTTKPVNRGEISRAKRRFTVVKSQQH